MSFSIVLLLSQSMLVYKTRLPLRGVFAVIMFAR